MDTEPPARPDVDGRPVGSWIRIAVVVAFGLFTDAVIDRPAGLGLTLGALLAAAALVVFARPRPVALPFVGGALALSAFVVIRASPVLAVLDVAAAAALLVTAATFARTGVPLATTMRAYAARTFVAPLAALPDAVALVAGPPRRLARSSAPHLRAFVRAVAWAAPIVVVLILLFGSADPVFARYAGTPLMLTPDAWPAHMVEIAIGTLALAVLLAVPARSLASVWLDRTAGPISVPLHTSTEWMVLLIATATVFGAFVAVQFTVFFGGRTHVLEQQGLTFAAYARSGFWQLLFAAGIAAAVIAAAWSAIPRPAITRDRRTFAVLSLTVIGLVLVVLVSAFRRLELYEEAYGFTWPRLLGHLAVLILAALLACAVVAVLTGRASWLPTAAVIVVVVAALALNAIDPERFITERNLARASSGASLDVRELSALSADAVPAIVAALPSLRPELRPHIEDRLACTRDELEDAIGRGWPSFNLSRSRALRLLDPLGLGSCPLHDPSD